jgi:hypothetical protein
MARAIERIEQDIAALEEAVRTIAQQLLGAYESYLTTLGQAARQQLILASYHLCTQGYPENFLSLSLNQRQKLQQGIRKLGQKAADVLPTLTTSAEQQEENKGEQPEEHNVDNNVEDISNIDNIDNIDEEDTEKRGHFPSLPPGLTPSFLITRMTPASCNTSNPVELAQWQQNIEKATQDTLKSVSREANLLLQKAGILPKSLPEQILEAAAAASEASAEVMPGPPNLLNLVIEIDSGQESEGSGLTQIMAFNLRLGEIEFADTALSSERKQIRHLLVQLNKLGQEYQKKQRERSIAEAEAAWRASWFEDK